MREIPNRDKQKNKRAIKARYEKFDKMLNSFEIMAKLKK